MEKCIIYIFARPCDSISKTEIKNFVNINNVHQRLDEKWQMMMMDPPDRSLTPDCESFSIWVIHVINTDLITLNQS